MTVGGLSRENNELIGFVISCLYHSAISMAEFRQWVLYIIDNNPTEELPLYVFDLVDYNDDLYKLDKVIGFVSDWKHSKADDLALEGIAVARGFNLFEPSAAPVKLLEALKKRSKVFFKFKMTFPFIDVSRIEAALIN